MNRVLTVFLIFVAGMLVALLVLGYFAYVIASGPPEEARVEGLDGAVVVGISDQRTGRVEASSLEDAMAGLGYGQAASTTWPLLVYHAAAIGRLSDLAGPEAFRVDERTIQLGIASAARKAYESLGAKERDLLTAFSRGVNAALSSHTVLRDPSLVLSGHTPVAWEPWHALAIERLFAWLATDPSIRSDRRAPPRPIRDALRLHDFDQSLIILSASPSEPGLFVRYVLGSSALPVLFESTLIVGGRPLIRGACILGTPFFVAGRTDTLAWAFLPEQTFSIETIDPDSVVVDLQRRVVTMPDGSERLVSILTSGGSVLLRDTRSGIAGTKGDFIQWRGLWAESDASAWLGLLSGKTPSFRLHSGTGVILSKNEVIYMPVRGRRLKGGRLIGSSDFTPYVAARLDTLMAVGPGFNPRLWSGDTYSPWAAEWAPRVLSSIAVGHGAHATAEEARSYLRNWDQHFGPTSIGASVFQAWAGEYYAAIGHWPGIPPVAGETARTDSLVRSDDYSLFFDRGVARLAGRFGYDLSVWRWEDVNAAEVFFPVLGSNSPSPTGAQLSRYAPRTVPGDGHPTTPNWSPITVTGARKAASTWEGWTRMTDPGEWTVRRWYPDVTRGVGSRFAPGESSNVTSLDVSASVKTRLVPAGRKHGGRPPSNHVRDSGG